MDIHALTTITGSLEMVLSAFNSILYIFLIIVSIPPDVREKVRKWNKILHLNFIVMMTLRCQFDEEIYFGNMTNLEIC